MVPEQQEQRCAWELTHFLKEMFRYNVFFTTRKEYIGLVPLGTRKDTDVVFFIDGLKVPFVLRDEADAWRLVGPCYIHGSMDAKAPRMDGTLGVQVRLRLI